MNSVEGQATRMRPHVICHMTSSIDGRALVPRWHPADAVPDGLWESARARIQTDAAIMGRVTALEYTQGRPPYPDTTETVERVDHLPPPGRGSYQVAIDPRGSLAWGRSDIHGSPIVVATTAFVSDRYLAGLRSDGVHYLFAGDTDIDLAVVLDKLGGLGVKRLYLDGGPITTGRFLHAGLIDELSLLLIPALDGYSDSPTIVEYAGDRDAGQFPVSGITLTSSEILDGGVVWLRYTFDNTARGE